MAQGFDAVLDNEAAWLATSPRTDSLPDLTTYFTVIQARFPRTPGKKQTQLYVLHDPHEASRVMRSTNQREMFTHNLLLRMIWPITTGKAEDDQLAFEKAVYAVAQVVLGLVDDHTHGGRFLSAAEDPLRLRIQFADPEYCLAKAPAERQYEATITFTVDDFELSN